jgi:prevent-host-death family protein
MSTARRVNVHQAKTQLSKLLAEVEQGREIVVARDGKPVARLVPFTAPAKKTLRTGDWRGRIQMAPDFDAPLSEKELDDWGA